MKKTISISLGGQSFQIEEDAYEKLAAYLKNVKEHCGDGADSAEVTADIEASMAEKLRTALGNSRNIVNIDDILMLINIMGTIEDFEREIGSNENEKEEKETKDKIKRKLYRDSDKAIIGGVASGLGNYFDIDPLLFRILFIVFTFFGGSSIILYILLWLLMPEAKTAYQKLEMHGYSPSITAFQNLIKEEKENLSGNESIFKKIVSAPLVVISEFFLVIKRIFRSLWPIFVWFFGLFLIFFSLMGIVGVCIGAFSAILYTNSNYQISFIPFYELSSIVPYFWMVVFGALSFILPGMIAFLCGLTIIKKKNLVSLSNWLVLFFSWIIIGSIFCALCCRYFPDLVNKAHDYQALNQTTKELDLKDVSGIRINSSDINVVVEENTEEKASLSGRKIDVERFEITNENGVITINGKPMPYKNDICISCDYYPATLKISDPENRIKIDEPHNIEIQD